MLRNEADCDDRTDNVRADQHFVCQPPLGTWMVPSLIGVGMFSGESNKAADTHANWLMDNDDSGRGAQWEEPDLHEKNT